MTVSIRPDNTGRQKQRPIALAATDYSSNSLLPMLVAGLVLIVIGMVAAAMFSF